MKERSLSREASGPVTSGAIQLGQVFKGVDDATTAAQRRAVGRTVGRRLRSHGR